MQKAVCIMFFLIILLTVSSKVYAISDPTKVQNNRFGIHILFPEEVELASEMVNSTGGDWGYVTIPISSKDRDLEKWQKFMDDAKQFHLIPIVRIATYPVADYWVKPTVFDPLDWANFLNSLDWPTKNRYIVVYNETNRAQEWENDLNPEDYAKNLSWTIEALKNVNTDFFVINGGFDAAAPNNHVLMDEFTYMQRMENAIPGIFKKIDGWSSHSYPNPNFSGSPNATHNMSVISYRHELEFLKNNFGVGNLPVFITETGWQHETLPKDFVANNYQIAFTQIWTDKNLIAVTPFLLSAGEGPFKRFSFLGEGNKPFDQYEKIKNVPKIGGMPEKPPGISETVIKDKIPEFKNSQNTKSNEIKPLFPFWKDIAKWFLHL